MNIAELKGEKTVKMLAKRLLAEPSKGSSKTTEKEMEAALLRLNPHLKQIGHLKKGTAILVPEEFRLAASESVNPFRGIAEALLRQSEDALTELRAILKERATESTEPCDKAGKFVRRDLLEGFFAIAAAAKALPKEQAAAIAAQLKALGKLQSQLKDIRAALPKGIGRSDVHVKEEKKK